MNEKNNEENNQKYPDSSNESFWSFITFIIFTAVVTFILVKIRGN